MKMNILVTGSNGQLGTEIGKIAAYDETHQWFFTVFALGSCRRAGTQLSGLAEIQGGKRRGDDLWYHVLYLALQLLRNHPDERSPVVRQSITP